MSVQEPARQGSPAAVRRRRWWRRWWLIALLVLLLAAADRGVRLLVARASLPTGRAAWIWNTQPPRRVEPQAFYAVRDFTLREVPERARLLVQGDEQYLLYLNGNRVGSNAYAAGSPLDVYDVAPLLVPGGNRLVAELRSSRGAGGFLLRLQGGDADLVVSDAAWRIFQAFDPGLLGGWRPAGEGEPPKVWGRPPVGRWGRPAPGPLRPLYQRSATDSLPMEPASRWRIPADPRSAGGEWWAWDWGREVTGYLAVELRRPMEGEAVFFARSELPPTSIPAADGFLVAPAGAPSWEDVVVRRFRYVAVAGLGGIDSVGVLTVAEELATALSAPAPEEGLLGLQVPRRLSPLEKAVRGGNED